MPKDKDEIGGGATDEATTQEAKPETTPEKTKAEEDVVTLSSKELNDRINAAKSELGRTLKSTLDAHTALKRQFDEQMKRNSELETNFNAFKQRDREEELEKFKDDKGMLDAVRLRHKAEDERAQVTRERSEFEKERSQHQARLEAAMKAEAETLAKELAADSGLTAITLLQIGSDSTQDGKTIYNLERMKAVAKSVPKGEDEGDGEEEVEEEKNAIRGQRSRAAGAGSRSSARGLQTLDDYYKAYNAGQISTEEMAKARIRFGVAY